KDTHVGIAACGAAGKGQTDSRFNTHTGLSITISARSRAVSRNASISDSILPLSKPSQFQLALARATARCAREHETERAAHKRRGNSRQSPSGSRLRNCETESPNIFPSSDAVRQSHRVFR